MGPIAWAGSASQPSSINRDAVLTRSPPQQADAAADAKKVAYWVQQADMQIQRERIDWRFLWVMTEMITASCKSFGQQLRVNQFIWFKSNVHI